MAKDPVSSMEKSLQTRKLLWINGCPACCVVKTSLSSVNDGKIQSGLLYFNIAKEDRASIFPIDSNHDLKLTPDFIFHFSIAIMQ